MQRWSNFCVLENDHLLIDHHQRHQMLHLGDCALPILFRLRFPSIASLCMCAPFCENSWPAKKRPEMIAPMTAEMANRTEMVKTRMAGKGESVCCYLSKN